MHRCRCRRLGDEGIRPSVPASVGTGWRGSGRRDRADRRYVVVVVGPGVAAISGRPMLTRRSGLLYGARFFRLAVAAAAAVAADGVDRRYRWCVGERPQIH